LIELINVERRGRALAVLLNVEGLGSCHTKNTVYGIFKAFLSFNQEELEEIEAGRERDTNSIGVVFTRQLDLTINSFVGFLGYLHCGTSFKTWSNVVSISFAAFAVRTLYNKPIRGSVVDNV